MTDLMDDILKDYKNWIRIDAKGMKNVSELEIATIVFNTAHAELGNSIAPHDILCAQYFENAWIIYTSGQTAKAKIISMSTITVHQKTFQMTEYSDENIRISIHGIPMHITDKEVEGWVDTFAVRNSDVYKHDVMDKEKVKGESCFMKLWSGHRVCYATSIHKDLPRFTTYDIPDPTKPTNLKKISVTVYFNKQTINCKFCKECDQLWGGTVDHYPFIGVKK